jgi:pyruvate/2-oxoglutarate dehydrogenase complex dihydrolipoamide dehydrogenase (E3) component
MDVDVGRVLEVALKEDGIDVVTDAQLLRVTSEGGQKSVWVKRHGKERAFAGEAILQALGRCPNISGLQLDAAGVAVTAGRIVIDGAMRTSQPHIYAVGDVNDVNPIVHIAIQQGEIAGYQCDSCGNASKRS